MPLGVDKAGGSLIPPFDRALRINLGIDSHSAPVTQFDFAFWADCSVHLSFAEWTAPLAIVSASGACSRGQIRILRRYLAPILALCR